MNKIKKPDFIKLSGSTDRNAISIKMLGNSADIVNFSQYFFSKLFAFKIKKQSLRNEKAVVIQEIRQYGNSSLEKFANVARNCSFKAHNLFDDEVLGTPKDIANFTTKDIYDFFDTHLVKDNISVLIAGTCSTLHKIKNDLNTYYLKTSSIIANDSVNYFPKETLLLEKAVIGKAEQKQLAQLSFIYKVGSDHLDKNRILALSMLFSLLNSGTYSLLSQMQRFVPKLYFFQAIPIFRKTNIYLQVLTSCSIQDAEIIENNINKVFLTLSKLNSDNLKATIHNLKFQHNLLFDGVEKSVLSFANMSLEQEKLIDLDSIDPIFIVEKFKKITTTLVDQAGSKVIAYM
ncbi:Peptidase, M16 family [Lactobacillus pasteurii DSM 23907 = CRBIP 24.76]|uniref:Peptidase, M16 family n=1 Tax=Lactobacillus pasteurii DSM 23907 = CRBIP 24.76 TaxID=1423790 RepID=I7LDH6_9LACO|nr:Peptidase, M16 family [Lactobacillus pasteurii DSM 23907 = CRBIP 24.76]